MLGFLRVFLMGRNICLPPAFNCMTWLCTRREPQGGRSPTDFCMGAPYLLIWGSSLDHIPGEWWGHCSSGGHVDSES